MGFKYTNQNFYFITYKTFCGKKYFIEEKDKEILVSQIKKAIHQYDLKIIAFVVLSNHYHILIKCLNWSDLRRALQLINGGSSFLVNKRYAIQRSIWGDKFNWAIKDENDFYKYLIYILGNPLKHGLVKSFEELRNYKFFNYNEVIKIFGQEFIDNLILNFQKFKYKELDNWDEDIQKLIRGAEVVKNEPTEVGENYLKNEPTEVG